MRASEREDTPAKNSAEDPKAKTKEVKIGCVFTHPKEGEDAFRDVHSTSYIPTM